MSLSPVQSSPTVKEQVSAAEWQTRVDLAASHRLVALQGGDDLSFTHSSAKVPGTDDFLMLHNHGLLTCGSSIADTFLMMFTFQRACDIQVLAQNGGAELITIEPQILAGAKAMVAAVTQSAQGMGGALAWPVLSGKLDAQDPEYKS